ncbi:MAG: N-acetylmuramoyl-L-alanine amidase [Candidatus Improbicoccus pseudotrichonymphae]|uniref:N-acetylmuramoyl-L-alanine amidase n=1 Tax=Candidatus Improbicoccus pseudotrichonymphae TaxID=3033792 RepID=A0AA48I1W1_9FIRM|nr:MAG: N-acetylmuramoyl-L-alanine amidase [Candidatus Improbicoccus pseudotrichonymphae]
MKILTSNKKNITIFLLVLFLFLFALFSLLFGIYIFAKDSSKKSNNDLPKLIIIDPGHGGEDGGAVVMRKEDNKQVVEKVINLDIAEKLRELLRLNGFQVVMTREKDKSIHDTNAKSIRHKKRSDLRNRVEIINQHSAKNNDTILVSIHQNKFPDEKYFGTQLFFSKNNPLGEKLANCIYLYIKSKLQPENKREIKTATSQMFILNKSEIASVIVECGFLSNENEQLKLTNKDYQHQMAFCIFLGIVDFFQKNK